LATLTTKFDIINQVTNCQACAFRQNVDECNTPSLPTGSIVSRYMLINSRATKESHMVDKPMSLQNELMISKVLKEAQINEDDCYITNMVKCDPNLKSGSSVPAFVRSCQTCISYNLNDEIALVKPKIIICLGVIVACSLFNDKTASLASRYQLAGAEVFVIDNPETLFRKGKAHTTEAVKTLKRAKECLNLYESAMRQNKK
jgi:uracil-DNA glycosylase family 4